MDVDHAVATFGRHVEHKIDEAIASRMDQYHNNKSKQKKPPSRDALRELAGEVWSLEVRQVLVKEFGGLDHTSGDIKTNRDGYRVEKDMTKRTGNPLIDRDIWKNSTIYYANGKIEECDENGTRVVVQEPTI